VRRPERGDPGLWRRSLVQPPLTDADESHCTDALRAQTAGATTRDRTTTTPPVTRAHECLITCGSGRRLWAARRWFWYRGGRSSVAQLLARALMGVSGNDIGLRECNSWRAKPG
jgi:hypothetical protein